MAIAMVFGVLSVASSEEIKIKEVKAQDGAYCQQLFMWRCQLNSTYIHHKKWVPAPDPDDDEDNKPDDVQQI